MSYQSILILIVILALTAACTAEPQTVIEEVTVEVEVTRQVEVPVEVTREVPLVEEVEVTRLVEVPLEVTRLVEVEVVVTATPEPTEEPTLEPTEEPTAVPPTAVPATAAAATTQPAAAEPPPPAAASSSDLLQQMNTTRSQMLSFGGMIDTALGGGGASCFDVVYLYDSITLAPTMDVSGGTAEEQNAYGHYRAAIDIFGDGARDMAGNCRDLLNDPERESTSVAPLQWTLARSAVNDAVNVITPGIQLLGGE